MQNIKSYYDYFINNNLDYKSIDYNVLQNFVLDYTKNNQILTQEQKDLLKNKINTLNIENNYRLQLILITLYKDNKDIKRKIVKQYYFNEASQVFENLNCTKLLYPTVKQFIKDFKVIFDENYYTQSVMYQKVMIYYFYYVSTELYPRGIEHRYFFKVLYKLFKRFIKEENAEMVFYIFVPLIMTSNSIATTQKEFKEFNDKVELKLEKFVKEVLVPKYNIPKIPIKLENKEKPKVAFLIESSTPHSINNIFYNLLKALKNMDEQKYQFIILNLEAPELGNINHQIVNNFQALGFEYYNLHQITNAQNDMFYNQIEKAIKVREFIISKEIGTLINIGNIHPSYTFLFTARAAVKQIYWSHGNFEYDIKEIDNKITSSGAIPNMRYKYDFIGSVLDADVILNDKEKEVVQNIKSSYPKKSYFIGYIGRLIKIDSDRYLYTVSRIMKRNKNVIYLACGGGDQDNIKEKVKKLGIADRFYFTGHINAKIYGYVLDLMLDPFPSKGGGTVREFAEKGRMVVFSNLLQNTQLYSFCEWNGYYKSSKNTTEASQYFFDQFVNYLSNGNKSNYSKKFIKKYYTVFDKYKVHTDYVTQYEYFVNLYINDNLFSKEVLIVFKALIMAQKSVECKYSVKNFLGSI